MLELMLDQDTTGIEWQLALSPVWKTVKRLTVCDGTNRSEFISHFNACTNLEFARFEAVDFSQATLNGDIFKNLTYLKLSPIDADGNEPKPILMLIQENCRLLKTLDYVFQASPGNSSLMLDIIRLNACLDSLTLRVNETLLQELTSVFSQIDKHLSVWQC